ncbi:MAG: hypothetical protein ACXWT0_03755 [Methylobacter sp.]
MKNGLITSRAGFDLDALAALDNVMSIDDLSDRQIQRARVIFKNGYGLSIIRGPGLTFGGIEGLFEIAPFDAEGQIDGSLFDEEDEGGRVLGYCDVEKVQHYLIKIGSIKND